MKKIDTAVALYCVLRDLGETGLHGLHRDCLPADDAAAMAKDLADKLESMGCEVMCKWSKPGRQDEMTVEAYKPVAVYAMTDGIHVKVGISNNPVRRLRHFATARPSGAIRILAVSWMETRTAALRAEQVTHDLFMRDAVGGEWFVWTDDIVKYVDSLGPDQPVTPQHVAAAMKRLSR